MTAPSRPVGLPARHEFGQGLADGLGPISGRQRVRLAARAGRAALWTAVLTVVWLVGVLVAGWSRRLNIRWRAFMMRVWALGLLRILGVRLSRAGAPPPRPFLLVTNHLSYLDILVLATVSGSVFVAKHEVRGWPAIGWLATKFGTIYLDRARTRDAVRALDRIEDAIAHGAGVVLFPEGTSSPGDRVYPFRGALLEWAARRSFPVHVAALTYATVPPDPPAHRCVCWWGTMTFLPHLARLCTLQGVRASLVFAPDPVVETDRRRLAVAAQDAIARRFAPVVSSESL